MYPVKQLRVLSDTRVLEIGTRIGVSICSGLLRDAGASVTSARPTSVADLLAAAAHADVVITSSDTDPAWIGHALHEAARDRKRLPNARFQLRKDVDNAL